MPSSFASALDSLTAGVNPAAALFSSSINSVAALQSNSLLSDPNSASNQSANVFATGNNFSSSVAALTNQFQNPQTTQFFNENEASMLSSALSGVTSQDLINLPNFSADLLNSATLDRVNPSWN